VVVKISPVNLALASVLFALSQPAFSREDVSAALPTESAPAETRVELRELPLIINSFDELNRYLRLADLEKSPLRHFSEDGLAKFVDSATFTELGLASFDTSAIADELTPTQAYGALALFGVDAAIAQLDFGVVQSDADKRLLDHFAEGGAGAKNCPLINNKQCVTPASCAPKTSWVCITCNCGIQTP